MIDYDEHIDDELKQMNEDGDSIMKVNSEAFHLDDHIDTIKLKSPIMTNGHTSVADCLELMREKRIGCLLIVEEGKLEGIFTERDIIRRIVGQGLSHSKIQVKNYMTADPDTLTPDAPLAFALNYMILGGYRHVPIVNEKDQIVACLSIKDLVKHIGNQYFSAISNLPPTPKNPGWATMDGG
ncbi:MAG: CBS domain-containing protein [Candidatus Marinimicrobia bacterium]|nr:CBS domain-containing protein [Candidatus Neomarinimicrobiota bacterium]